MDDDVLVCVGTSGSAAADRVCSAAALAVGPVMPSAYAAPPMTRTPTSAAAMIVAERLFILHLLCEWSVDPTP